MLEHYQIDISEGIDINKKNELKESDICHYWYFLDKGSKYEPCLCNEFHDLLPKPINVNYVALFSLKGVNIEFILDI